MKIIVGRTNLVRVLENVSKALGNSITISTTCFRFKMGTEFSIAACNFETSITQTMAIPSEDKDFFDVLIPADVLMKYLSNLPDQPIAISFERFESKDEVFYNILIECGESGKVKMTGYDGAEFPVLKIDKYKTVNMDYKDVFNGLYCTEDAMIVKGEEQNVPHIHFEAGESGASFTGASRAYLATYAVDGNFPDTSVLLPIKIVNTLTSLKLKGDCEIRYNNDRISFKVGDCEIRSVLKAGTFIDWREKLIIPEDYVTFEKEEFLAAAKRALIFANKHNQQLAITIAGNKINIKGEDKDFNYKTNEVVSCSNFASEITICLDGVYLLRLLNKLPVSENVYMFFSTPMKFVIFRCDIDSKNMSLLGPQQPNS